jgi:hypothetical protein
MGKTEFYFIERNSYNYQVSINHYKSAQKAQNQRDRTLKGHVYEKN